MPPENQPAPVLALDIGNVCVRVELERLLAAMGFADMDALRAFDPEGRLNALCEQVENGRLSPDRFLAEFGAALPCPQSAATARRTWEALIGAEIPGMAALVDEAVAAGLQVVMLSDICDIHYRLVCSRLSFARLIHGAVLSCEVGALKPAPAMYRTVEERFCNGRRPLLFTDDKPANIEAAQARGWAAHCFTGVAGLRQCLQQELAGRK